MNDLWHSLSPPKSYFRIPISHNFKRTALTVFGSPRQGCPNDVDYEIVGVVGDTLYQVGKEPMATMYFPILEGDQNAEMLAVAHSIGSLTILRAGGKQIASLDPELPVSAVLTMDQMIGESLVDASLTASLVLAFAILSLLLASVGLYGVLSYITTQPTTELGIRMALRATRPAFTIDAGRRPAPDTVRARPWPVGEHHSDAYLSIDALRNKVIPWFCLA